MDSIKITYLNKINNYMNDNNITLNEIEEFNNKIIKSNKRKNDCDDLPEMKKVKISKIIIKNNPVIKCKEDNDILEDGEIKEDNNYNIDKLLEKHCNNICI